MSMAVVMATRADTGTTASSRKSSIRSPANRRTLAAQLVFVPDALASFADATGTTVFHRPTVGQRSSASRDPGDRRGTLRR
jgi:hypothetical protein